MVLVTILPVLAGCTTGSASYRPIPLEAFTPLETLSKSPAKSGTWPCFQGDSLHRSWREVSHLPKSFDEAWSFKLQDLVFEYIEGVSVFTRNAVFIPGEQDGIVVVGAYDRNVYGLRLETGERVWVKSTSGPVSATPVVSRDKRRVYVVSGDRSVYCLSPTDGSVIWKYETMPWSYTSYASVAGDLTLFFQDGREYLLVPLYNADRKAVRNYRDGSLYLFDSLSGKLIKKTTIADTPLSGVLVLPHKDGPIVIGATTPGTLFAVDLMSGKYYWKRVLAGRNGGTPVLTRVNDTWFLLVGDAFGTAWVLDPVTGDVRWTKKTGLFIKGSMAVYPPGRLMAVPSEDRFVHLFGLPDGTPKGTIKTGKYINSAPLFLSAGERVTLLTASMDEKLYWVDLKTMKPIQVFKTSPLRWKYEKRAVATWSSPQAVETDGTVYLLYGDMGGVFRCYKSSGLK